MSQPNQNKPPKWEREPESLIGKLWPKKVSDRTVAFFTKPHSCFLGFLPEKYLAVDLLTVWRIWIRVGSIGAMWYGCNKFFIDGYFDDGLDIVIKILVLIMGLVACCYVPIPIPDCIVLLLFLPVLPVRIVRDSIKYRELRLLFDFGVIVASFLFGYFFKNSWFFCYILLYLCFVSDVYTRVWWVSLVLACDDVPLIPYIILSLVTLFIVVVGCAVGGILLLLMLTG